MSGSEPVNSLQKRSLKLRFLSLAILLALLASALLFSLHSSMTDRERKRALDELEITKDRNITLLFGEVDRHRSIMFQLKLSIIRERILSFEGGLSRTELEHYLIRYFDGDTLVSQVRWIDAQGQEQVRIDASRRDGGAFVAATNLQDKSHRYYFREVISYPPDRIFLSPIDLNVEEEKVVFPFQPTIRLALRTSSEEGLADGVLIINLDLTTLFEEIYRSVPKGLIFRLIRDDQILIDTESEEESWRNMLTLQSADGGGTMLDPTLPVSADSNYRIADIDEVVESVGLKMSSGADPYTVHTKLSAAKLAEINFNAYIQLLPFYFLVLIAGFWLVNFIYRFELKTLELNGLLQDKMLEAERVSAFKSSFLANMSHEIRTPLTTIIGYIDLIRQGSEGGADRRREDRQLSRIDEAAHSLLFLINDILDFSRIQAGALQLVEEEINIESVLDKSVALFASEASRKNLDFDVIVDPALFSLIVRGDGLRLQQVLNNLIGNAIKFTDRGRVAVNLELVGSEANQVRLRFVVADTGAGLGKDNLEELTKPFVQGEMANTRKHGGSGLGLSIVRQLLELMGSELQARSAEGVGSAFSFEISLPLVSDSVERFEEMLHHLPKNVLIRSDKTSLTEFLRKIFSHWDCRSDTVRSDDEVLQRLLDSINGDRAIGLIVVDGIAERIGAAEFFERIKALYESASKSMPALLLIEKRTLSPEFTALLSGFKFVSLQAPLTASKLLESLDSLGVVSKVASTKSRDTVRILSEVLRQRIAQHGAPKVLIADDNFSNLALLEEIFGSFDIVVQPVDNGLKAVEKVRQEHYDLVFLDIQMPVMDGLDAVRQIRAFLAGRRLPVIALTAASFESDVEASKRAGFDAHLVKPINLEHLITVILEYWQLDDARESRAENAAGTLAVPGGDESDVPTNEAALTVTGDAVPDVSPMEQALERLFQRPEFQPEMPIYKIVGAQGYKRVVGLFVEGMEELLQKYGTTIDTLSFDEKRKVLHKITGAAASVDATQLGRNISKLRNRVYDDHATSLQPALDELRALIALLKEDLLSVD